MRELNEEQLNALLAVSRQRMAMFDESLKFVNVDAAFEAMLGYAPGELQGQLVEVMIHPSDWQRVRERIRRRFKGEEQISRYVFLGRRKDGSEVHISTVSSLVNLEGHRVTLAVCEDISSLMQHERRRLAQDERLPETGVSVIHALAHMSNLRDPYTGRHEMRVGILAAAIGEEMRLGAVVCAMLNICGSVHDIGKIAVPIDILSRPGKLSAAEYEVVKAHAEHSYQILNRINLPEPTAIVAHQHHERIDGSGYPQGLKGDDIILESRIMAVADVVETMASHRPYRAGLGIDAALAEITAKAGQCYDGEVATACVRLFRERKFVIPPAV